MSKNLLHFQALFTVHLLEAISLHKCNDIWLSLIIATCAFLCVRVCVWITKINSAILPLIFTGSVASKMLCHILRLVWSYEYVTLICCVSLVRKSMMERVYIFAISTIIIVDIVIIIVKIVILIASLTSKTPIRVFVNVCTALILLTWHQLLDFMLTLLFSHVHSALRLLTFPVVFHIEHFPQTHDFNVVCLTCARLIEYSAFH